MTQKPSYGELLSELRHNGKLSELEQEQIEQAVERALEDASRTAGRRVLGLEKALQKNQALADENGEAFLVERLKLGEEKASHKETKRELTRAKQDVEAANKEIQKLKSQLGRCRKELKRPIRVTPQPVDEKTVERAVKRALQSRRCPDCASVEQKNERLIESVEALDRALKASKRSEIEAVRKHDTAKNDHDKHVELLRTQLRTARAESEKYKKNLISTSISSFISMKLKNNVERLWRCKWW